MSADDDDAPLRAAVAMRDLPEAERDALIAVSADVLDLRPALEYRARQRQLAEAYRSPKGKPPGAPA